MLRIFFIANFLFSGLAVAEANIQENVIVDGNILFKQDGRIQSEEAMISVPPRGQGDLFVTVHGEKIKAKRFFSKQRSGRTLFYVILPVEERTKHAFGIESESETESNVIMKGTYLRGSNQVLYYGEAFLVKSDTLDMKSEKEPKMRHYQYLGAFMFKKDIDRL